MERCAAHRDAADEHGLQLRHRRERPGAADLHFDRLHLGDLLLRRILVGNRPARLARHVAELALPAEIIHLVNHAVDIERQPLALGTNARVILHQALGAMDDRAALVHRHAEGLDRVQQLAVPAGQPHAVDHAVAVRGKGQRPLCGDLRVELAHRAGRGIARIDEQLLAQLGLAPVHALEGGARHVDLAAHFEHVGRFALEHERDAVDRAHVCGDVFAHFAVAARCRPREPALFVAQADGKAVELELRAVLYRGIAGIEPELAPDARIEIGRAAVLRVGLRADREHRQLVPHRREVLGRCAAHALGGRVGRRELGVLALELYELAEQAVVLGVRDLRRILDVVKAVVKLDLRTQLRGPLARVGHEKTRRASALPGSMPQPASRARTASSSRPTAASARSSSSRPASSTRRPPRVRASSRPARAIAS